jgi:hypothetical protein
MDGQPRLVSLAVREYVRVGDALRAQVEDVNESPEQIGVKSGRGNVAEVPGLPGFLPLVTPNCFDDMPPFFVMGVMPDLISNLPAPGGV